MPKFAVYFRKGDHRDVIKNDNQDAWGWEPVDSFQYDTLKEAMEARAEYAKAFPDHAVVVTNLRIFSEIKSTAID